MYADRRDAGTGAQLSSSRDRRDGGAGAHLPLLTGVVQMRPGARTDVGPPLRFLTSGPSLGFGAWAVGGTEWGAAAAEPERLAAIHRALELGVTFFDTAPTYGDGTSETLLGQALKADRDRVAIATKVGPRDDPRRSLEASLRRLATDYVDLIQLHEALDGWERRLEQLHTLQEKGKALAVAWVLGQPGVGIVLAGARSPEQVEQNLAGARPLPPAALAEVDRIVADAFPSVRATEALKQEASTWGDRERFIVQRLDGKTSAELIAALWTDGHATPMVAAQVKVFCDQLAERGLVG